MQSSITLDVLSAVSEKGFSLDELVIETKALFEKEGMAVVIGLILRLVDEKVCMDMVIGKRSAQKPCCSQPRYGHQGQVVRQFRTSAGTVKIRWRRLECKWCGNTIIPLREFLGLEPYQSKSSELEKMVAEVVSEQSYRRSSSHLDIIGQIPVPKSTAHRWVAQSDCDTIKPHNDTLDILFADGSGYKRRPDKANNINNRGELRVAVGVDKSGSIVPLGAFSGKSWDEISSIIKGQRDADEPVADILISDGERGLGQGLTGLCGGHQRSHWHLIRALNYTMWQDDAGKLEREQMQKKLTAIIGIELPEEDFEMVNDSYSCK